MENIIIITAVFALIIYAIVKYKTRWKKYDPTWLVALAEEQYPKDLKLHNSIKKCTLIKGNYFVNPTNANQTGSEWQFETSITLIHPEMDDIILDILKDGRIGSIEYLGLMMKNA